MPVIVDGMRSSEARPTTVSDVIESIYEKQRFIKEILMDGEPVALDVVQSLRLEAQDSPLVEITTCSLDELIEDAMQSARDVVPALYREFSEVAHHLRVGDEASGASKFANAMDAFQWNHQLLARLSSLQPGPSAIHDLHDESIRIIPVLLDAWEMEDLVMLADVLEYEALPFLQTWFGIIELFHSERKREAMKRSLSLN